MVSSSQSGSAQPGTVDYTGICQIIEGKACADLKGTAVLIDVRPPTEIAKSGGSIPTAKNIPLADINDALKADPNDFQAKYKFTKPEQQQPLVFFCHAGVRCRAAAEQAKSLGYNSYCYPGSWSEWQEKCKK